ncbi:MULTISPECIES: hypothetical protein [unclassified Gemella]|uniref:hypothetical protein n=1 Tax=unclassified Gemella TaxID=2624949 RepID=UPI001C0405FF|nr:MULTISPECIES: hypothetical protein [unclassified Gemella]MBU0279406.1 hypothetical protein [Gemella sp. zg-1178]QWQ38334.1 hypothetical protein KMP11_05065 [Gemella sp. zg-570]
MKKEIEELLNGQITAYKISKDTGIPNNNIYAFMSGKRKIDNMTLATAEKLYNYYKQTKKGSK